MLISIDIETSVIYISGYFCYFQHFFRYKVHMHFLTFAKPLFRCILFSEIPYIRECFSFVSFFDHDHGFCLRL